MSSSLRTVRVAFSAALAVLGMAAALGGYGYGLTQENGQIGAGFLPVVLGVAMTVLAAADIVGTVRRGPDAQEDAGPPPVPEVDALGRTQRTRNRMLLVVTGMLVVALFLVPVLGLLLSLGLLMLAVVVFIERRRVLAGLLVAGITVTVFHVLFGKLLQVPLPTGMIGLV